MIEVLQAGFYSSVQDLGRHGYRSSGVGRSGAMDTLALRIVNALLGNEQDAAAVEITLGRFAVRFLTDSAFAIGGADAGVTLDDVALPNWWTAVARKGQVLRWAAPRSGVRSYLALQGGIDVPALMGSCATDLKGGFGGKEGRLLKVGDSLTASASASASVSPSASVSASTSASTPASAAPPVAFMPGFGLSVRKLDPYPELSGGTPVVDILPSTAWHDYPEAAHALLTQTQWKVSPQSNRIGSRLEGPVLEPLRRREMHSHGILPGVIQVPPSGQPIVQLCDGNTCGGYPVIATVIQPHLHLFAQLAPGKQVRLRLTDIDGAMRVHNAQQALLRDISFVARAARERAHTL